MNWQYHIHDDIIITLVFVAVYEVRVKTGDVSKAGTDANVFVTLIGDRMMTSKLPLKNKSKNNFERGKEDVFLLEAEDVGNLTTVRLIRLFDYSFYSFYSFIKLNK